MIHEIAQIRGVELPAATDRGLAMLALRPLSAALGGDSKSAASIHLESEPMEGTVSNPSPPEKFLAFAAEIEAFTQRPPMAGAAIRVPADCVDAAAIVMFHWGRTVKALRAISILVRSGLSEEAIVLLRTLVEVFIETAFLGKRPEDARLYLNHGTRTEIEWWRRIGSIAPSGIRQSAELQKALTATELTDFSGEPKPLGRLAKSSWHPQFRSVRSRAIEAGVAPWMYDLVYSLASRYTHGSGDWMRELARPGSPPPSRIRYQGDAGEGALALMLACWCVVEQLRLMNGLLNLELDPSLAELERAYHDLHASEWTEVMARYKDLQASSVAGGTWPGRPSGPG